MSDGIEITPEQRQAEQAATTFEAHKARRVADNEWELRRPGTGQFWTRVVAGAHGHLIVYGDIDPVIFAYGPRTSPEGLVHWIGGKPMRGGHPSYVAQKAVIGMCCREAVWTWDEREARDAIALLREDGYPGLHAIPVDDRGRDAVLEDLYDAGVESESLADLGMVIASRIYYAHAALRRLSRHLEEATQ